MVETKVYEDDDVIVWETIRPDGIDRRTEHKPGTVEANRQTLNDQARSALGNNRTFLAVASPTNAQVLAQLRAVTRQANGLIRLVLDQLDDVE